MRKTWARNAIEGVWERGGRHVPGKGISMSIGLGIESVQCSGALHDEGLEMT